MRLLPCPRPMGTCTSFGPEPWLRDADALLVTSRFEGGPAVAVEALALGVPVVSTDCSDFLRDIITVPETGRSEAGRIIASRKAEALAGALHEVCQRPHPAAGSFAPLIAHLAPDPCADAYLAWFDAVVRGGQP